MTQTSARPQSTGQRDLAFGQLALNHLGGRRLRDWYRHGLGLLPSGGSLFAGPPASKVNGLPFPLFTARWLMDGRDWVQIELFRFIRPRPRPRRADETAADHGYRRAGFHVRDLDLTLARLADLGSLPEGPVLGEARRRRACVRDPEGNWIELMEADPLAGDEPGKRRAEVAATLRAVTISVPDLDLAARSWADAIGLEQADRALHSAADEAIWGLEGAERRALTLDAGGVLIELVEYGRPPGRPLPAGHRICDQGIMNVAFVARDRAAFDRAFERWVGHGLRPTSRTPLEVGIFRVMYFELPSGENVELLYPRRWAWRLTGFVPQGWAPTRLRRSASTSSRVWASTTALSRCSATAFARARSPSGPSGLPSRSSSRCAGP
jgi:catechol 2,3-dioxygenase-like lactoylglutathione lyase family enzyme